MTGSRRTKRAAAGVRSIRTSGDREAALEPAVEALCDGVRRGLHLGAQLVVLQRGRQLAEVAVGAAAPGRPMRIDSILPWFSATKVLTALAVARLWEVGALGLDDPVGGHWPAFARHDKDGVTVRQLLTHTSGLDPILPAIGFASGWDELVTMVADRPIEPGWDHRRHARYGPVNTFALGGLIEAVTGDSYPDHLREHVLGPLDLHDTHLGVAPDLIHELADRWSPAFDTSGGEPTAHAWLDDPAVVGRFHPAGGGRGPASQLARVYEAVLDAFAGRSGAPVRPATIEAVGRPHRLGIVDATFGAPLAWGLGVVVPDGSPAREPVPYGFGPRASARAMGHAGYQSSQAFADPEYGLAVAVVFNGTPGDEMHERRMASVLEEVYRGCGIPSPLPVRDQEPSPDEE